MLDFTEWLNYLDDLKWSGAKDEKTLKEEADIEK